MADPCQQQSLFVWEDGLRKPSEVPSNPYFYDSTHLSNISLLYPVTMWLSWISSSLISPLFLKQYVISSSLDIWQSERWFNLYCDASVVKRMQRDIESLVSAKKWATGCQVAGWLNKLYALLVHKQQVAVTQHWEVTMSSVTGNWYCSLLNTK